MPAASPRSWAAALDEAAEYFTQALTRASSDNDHEMIGRCSNNLGIISHLRGRHAEAIGSFEVALAAFERAGARRGAGECHNNLAIAFRQQGALDRALAEADRAVEDAERAGDGTLWALTSAAAPRSAWPAVSWTWPGRPRSGARHARRAA